MTYRDDRNALHARTHALEREVEALRAHQQHAEREHARELALARAGLPSSTAAPSVAWRGLAWGGGAALLLTAGLYLWSYQAPPPPPPRIVPVAPHPVIAPPPISAPLTAAHATWNAKVSTARGVALRNGSSCVIAADVAPRGVLANETEEVRRVVVSCGHVTLYDSEHLEHDESTAVSAFERGFQRTSPHYDPFGNTRANLRYDEEGGVNERKLPRISIATALGTVLLTRARPALHVELRVEPGSGEVRTQEPLPPDDQL